MRKLKNLFCVQIGELVFMVTSFQRILKGEDKVFFELKQTEVIIKLQSCLNGQIGLIRRVNFQEMCNFNDLKS